VRKFAISAANFSTSTLVLQKQHSFEHWRRFSQVHKQKPKAVLHTNFKLWHIL